MKKNRKKKSKKRKNTRTHLPLKKWQLILKEIATNCLANWIYELLKLLLKLLFHYWAFYQGFQLITN